MEFAELLDFVQKEHRYLVTHHGVEGDPKTKYTMLVKLMEELGELSEVILTLDTLQRSDKLNKSEEDLEAEFADVLFVTLILAQEMNVDMVKALGSKMETIKKRHHL